MEAGNARVTDPHDTKHHKMDSVVCGHHIYKSMWMLVIEQLVLEKEPANPHDKFAVTVIKYSQIMGNIPKNYSQIIYYMKGLCHLWYY